MKLIRTHPYSIAAYGLVTAELFVMLGLTSNWVEQALSIDSGLVYRLTGLYPLLSLGSLALAVLGVIKERPKALPIIALGTSWGALFVCGLRFAV